MGDFPDHARQIGLLRNDNVDLRQGAGESNRWLRLKPLRVGEGGHFSERAFEK